MRCCEASGLMEGAGRADALGIAGMAAGATATWWAESCNKSRRNLQISTFSGITMLYYMIYMLIILNNFDMFTASICLQFWVFCLGLAMLMEKRQGPISVRDRIRSSGSWHLRSTGTLCSRPQMRKLRSRQHGHPVTSLWCWRMCVVSLAHVCCFNLIRVKIYRPVASLQRWRLSPAHVLSFATCLRDAKNAEASNLWRHLAHDWPGCNAKNCEKINQYTSNFEILRNDGWTR